MSASGLKRRDLLFGAAALAAAPAVASAQSGGQGDFDIPGVRHVLTIRADLAPAETAQGPFGEMVKIPITGGRFEGQGIAGEILPGGADWQRLRSDGVRELDARYEIRADDGALIRVHNHALVAEDESGPYVRSNPRFIAPVGPHDWLNKAIFVGTVQPSPGALTYVTIRVFKVT